MLTSLPDIFLKQVETQLGAQTGAFTACLSEPARRGLRMQRWQSHPMRSNQSASGRTLPLAVMAPLPPVVDVLSEGILEHKVPWYTDAFYLSPGDPIGKSIWHELGAVYIQEPSAMAAVAALAPQPGEAILDLCAAPGSKSTAIGKALRGTGTFVCNEIHPTRVLTLAQNLERAGIPALVVNAAPPLLAKRWPAKFDGVLVDAPCSGEGMFRKDPEAVAHWSPDLVPMCAERDLEILTAAVQLVRPGGRLVYSTCTLNEIENEQVIAWALTHLPLELEALPDWPGWDAAGAVAGTGVDLSGARRLWPHRGLGEGHFVARFRVINDESASARPKTVRQARTKPLPDLQRVILEWLNEAAIPKDWHQPVIHGDAAFIAMTEALPLEGIRVVRNGLCLAVRDHHAWKPHHQFAIALQPGTALQERNLSPAEAARYVLGEPLDNNDLRGYVWLHLDGLPLGFGKAVPGRINNLYPKGLRKRVST